MLGFAKAETVPVEVDEQVRDTQGSLQKAHADREKVDAKEMRFIRIANGMVTGVTDEEYRAAQDQLQVRKGTQTGWFLPEAEEARRAVVPLQQAYNQAVAAARQRLNEAGTMRLKELCGELYPVLKKAMGLAGEIEALRQEVGQAGADIGTHPVTALLPGQLVQREIELMKDRGLI